MAEARACRWAPESEQLSEMMGELRGRGVGIVYISPRLPEVLRIADRVTVLRDGALVATRDVAGLDEAELIRLMVGRELTAVFPKRRGARGGVALEARGLGCAASGVRNVSFRLHAGEILGLAGLVGPGRTELARVPFGLPPPHAGEILLGGQGGRLDTP